MKQKIALIIGAGPAGLTAAYELITKTDIKPIVIEKSNDVGGISKTVVYHGNRIDIGGHRFFSKSDMVMNWWREILPMQGADSKDDILKALDGHRGHEKLTPGGPDPETEDRVMLVRSRLSRIFFLQKFFDYPLSLNLRTVTNLGLMRIFRIGFTYLRSRIFPRRDERSLEDFFINRFGTELYQTFFKDYTEKVWGVPCAEIAADWGAQRIKKLSIARAVGHALKSMFRRDGSIEQKNTETSLIEQFMYPKLGPGQLWELVADRVEKRGGVILKNSEVVGLTLAGNRVASAEYVDRTTGAKQAVAGDYFFSTMPVSELIDAIGSDSPAEVKAVSDGLKYRDFVTVGLLLNRLKIKNETAIATINGLVPDTWIYIQERDVKIGRLQIFNNWSPYMVADIDKVWIGLEYFCNEGDDMWNMPDGDFIASAIDELHRIGIIDKADVLDSTIIRMPKTYPAYFGSYPQFHVIRKFTDSLENLFLIGRNGMHKYNNQDHSMLTAIEAVHNIVTGRKGKENIWNINTEDEYHEGK